MPAWCGSSPIVSGQIQILSRGTCVNKVLTIAKEEAVDLVESAEALLKTSSDEDGGATDLLRRLHSSAAIVALLRSGDALARRNVLVGMCTLVSDACNFSQAQLNVFLGALSAGLATELANLDADYPVVEEARRNAPATLGDLARQAMKALETARWEGHTFAGAFHRASSQRGRSDALRRATNKAPPLLQQLVNGDSADEQAVALQAILALAASANGKDQLVDAGVPSTLQERAAREYKIHTNSLRRAQDELVLDQARAVGLTDANALAAANATIVRSNAAVDNAKSTLSLSLAGADAALALLAGASTASLARAAERTSAHHLVHVDDYGPGYREWSLAIVNQAASTRPYSVAIVGSNMAVLTTWLRNANSGETRRGIARRALRAAAETGNTLNLQSEASLALMDAGNVDDVRLALDWIAREEVSTMLSSLVLEHNLVRLLLRAKARTNIDIGAFSARLRKLHGIAGAEAKAQLSTAAVAAGA